MKPRTSAEGRFGTWWARTTSDAHRLRELAGALSLLLAGGGGLFTTYLPGLPPTYHVRLVRILAVCALGMAALQVWPPKHWPHWRYQVLEAICTVLLGTAIYATGGGDFAVATAMIGFLIILDAALFQSTRAMLAQVVFLIAAVVTVLSLLPGIHPASICFVGIMLTSIAAVSFGLIHTREATELDFLTGLTNQRGFERRLGEALAGATRDARPPPALIYLDVTDASHRRSSQPGNETLRDVVQRWQPLLPPGTVLAHFGGGRFGLYGSAGDYDPCLGRLAEQVGPGLACHAGLTLAEPGDTVAALAGRASAALHSAKRQNLGKVAHHPGSYSGDTQVRAALKSREFVLRYQPIVDLSDGAVIGAEALVRWQRGGELLAPDRFIGDAELAGAIVDLGAWVVREACRQAALWPDSDGRRAYVSVNVSGRELREPGYADRVATALRDSGLPPQRLLLEFTETAYDDDAAVTTDNLARLRAIGVRIAVDDFGTGHSNLARLSRFDVDVLKIDKSFVTRIGMDDKAGTLTAAMLAMSRALHLATVAEGVEYAAQAEWLRRQGCDAAQGYLYGNPMPDEALLALFARRPPRHTQA